MYCQQVHDEFNRMVMNVVFVDLLICSYGIPVDIAASLSHGWKMGRTMCYASGFLLTAAGE